MLGIEKAVAAVQAASNIGQQGGRQVRRNRALGAVVLMPEGSPCPDAHEGSEVAPPSYVSGGFVLEQANLTQRWLQGGCEPASLGLHHCEQPPDCGLDAGGLHHPCCKSAGRFCITQSSSTPPS